MSSKESSNFPFVRDVILRKNIDDAFDHILTLLPFTESRDYNDTAKSSFRKTIIIYTASIVEALLFYIFDNKFSCDDVCDHYAVWKLKEEKVLHIINENEKIVSGKYVRVLGDGKKEKMNLGEISNFLRKKKVLSEQMFLKIDKLRKLRNEQHIGTHKKIPVYNKKNLEEAFSIAREVKEFSEKESITP